MLKLPKQPEPTNREAFNSIIGRQPRGQSPKSPICVGFDADAPKPPTYPFNNNSFKERGHKTNNTPELRAYLPSCLQIFPAISITAASTSVLRFRVPSASVKGCLGPVAQTRKRKNAALCENFMTHAKTPAMLGIFVPPYPAKPAA